MCPAPILASLGQSVMFDELKMKFNICCLAIFLFCLSPTKVMSLVRHMIFFFVKQMRQIIIYSLVLLLLLLLLLILLLLLLVLVHVLLSYMVIFWFNSPLPIGYDMEEWLEVWREINLWFWNWMHDFILMLTHHLQPQCKYELFHMYFTT